MYAPVVVAGKVRLVYQLHVGIVHTIISLNQYHHGFIVRHIAVSCAHLLSYLVHEAGEPGVVVFDGHDIARMGSLAHGK